MPADRVTSQAPALSAPPTAAPIARDKRQAFDLRRLFSYTRIETLGLRRDPIRATLALLGLGLALGFSFGNLNLTGVALATVSMVVTAIVMSSAWCVLRSEWNCFLSTSSRIEMPNELIIATTSHQALMRHQNQRSR